MDQDSIRTDWEQIYSSSQSDEVLHGLVVRYMERVRQHAKFQWANLSEADIEDFVQSFLVRLLQGEVFASADEKKGRFRTYFLRCFDNHVRDNLRPKSRAEVPLEDWEQAVETTNEIWAIELFRSACDTLREQCESAGTMQTYQIANDRFISPILEATGHLSYEEIRDKYQLTSIPVTSGRVRSAKRALEGTIRRIICSYVIEPQDVELEIEHLIAALPAQLALTSNKISAADFLYSDWAEDLEEFSFSSDGSFSIALVTQYDFSTYLDLLTHPKPPIFILNMVRQMAKEWLRTGDQRVPSLAQKCVYYVTAAASIAIHNDRISALTDDQLRSSLHKINEQRDRLPDRLSEHLTWLLSCLD